MKQTKALKDVLRDSLEGLDASFTASDDERKQAIEDREFYSIAGKQWEGKLGEQFENKPKFEFNKVHLAVIRIINEYRNNPVTVDFISKDGVDASDLADTCDALYRADEQDSCADEAYDNAFEEAVGGGMGAYRLISEYEDESDEDNDDQRIRFVPITDADQTVFFDVNAKHQDKSDAQCAWLLTGMSPEFYESKYGKSIDSIDMEGMDYTFDWFGQDVVYIAEYYEVEDVGETIYTYASPTGEEKKLRDSDFEEDETLKEILSATGWKLEKTRKVKVKRVHKYIHDGSEVLEDCGYIAGTEIPIVVTYGKRWFVRGVERFMGHVRLGKDPQRLKNMQISKLAEFSALSSMQKPILTPEQVTGHQDMWAEDNINQYPYLLINAVEDAAGQKMPPQQLPYTQPAQMPPVMAAFLTGTENDLQDILGNAGSGEQLEPNQSGVAVELVQKRLDMQSFIYTSNNAKARRRGGEIWLSMAKDLYRKRGRKMRGLTKEGDTQSIEINRPVMVDGVESSENDIANANFLVATEVGPASSSRKSATVRALSGMVMMVEDPQDKAVIVGTAIQNMEGEGLSELREHYRKKMVGMGVSEPNDEDLKEQAKAQENAKPDPNAAFLEASSQKALADADKAKAETLKIMDQIKQIQADTLETLSKVGAMEQQQAIDAARMAAELSQPQQPAQMAPEQPPQPQIPQGMESPTQGQ